MSLSKITAPEAPKILGPYLGGSLQMESEISPSGPGPGAVRQLLTP